MGSNWKSCEYGAPIYCMLVFKLEEVTKEEKGTNYHSLRKLRTRGQRVMKVVIQTVLYEEGLSLKDQSVILDWMRF